MKRKDLRQLGIGEGELFELSIAAISEASQSGQRKRLIRKTLQSVVKNPGHYGDDPVFGQLATKLAEVRAATPAERPPGERAPYRQWGGHDVDREAVQQLENACSLPVAVRGALMPDAHVGYGLPIGGVLATRDAVIPYAVGVDIACRVKLSVFDLPTHTLGGQVDRLRKAIENETRFGIGAAFKRDRREHAVLDDDWSISPVTQRFRDKAWAQLGTSGSGNHFVEFGLFELAEPELGLEPGEYLALLSHSGSRGTGASVANHYSRLAMQLHPELPKHLRHLAWLDLSSEAGQEYWQAMQLMGRYAAANHACIHYHVAKTLGAKVLLDVENHHNFAWKEEHDGETVIVHRKGATPAEEGVLGVIPGSMASAAYVVRGLGEEASLDSAAHGAGRVMSRKHAHRTLTWSDARKQIEASGVTLLSAGLDEVPAVYRDIEEVMANQRDLVTPLARFWPKIVKMAPPGERPED